MPALLPSVPVSIAFLAAFGLTDWLCDSHGSAGKDSAIPAGEALRACVASVGGKGGGTPAFAQGVVTGAGERFGAVCEWAKAFVK
jgi:alanyl-tRNA synthetase